MSHFLCLVAGRDVDEQLAPFHEFECTGYNDEYVQEIDITEKLHNEYISIADSISFLGYLTKERNMEIVPYTASPNIEGNHKYGYVELTSSGEVKRVVTRTNPNYKWDWYTIGGRWSQCLKISGQERRVNSALKKQVDFKADEDRKREHALETWCGWHQEGVKHLPDDDKKKEAWIQEHFGLLAMRSDIERLDSMEMIEYAECISIWAPYALVWDQTWYEKGHMGWFGVSVKEESDWGNQFKMLWKQIHDDELITVVDCHT